MLRRLTLPLAVLAMLAFAAPAAQAAKGMYLGIQDDSVLVDHYWGNSARSTRAPSSSTRPGSA